MKLTNKEKEEFASKIVDNYDMETLVDTAVLGILNSWKENPELLKEEIENRPDLISK